MIEPGSWFAVNRKLPGRAIKAKPDYFFRVSTTDGNFSLTNHLIPLTHIRGNATVSPMMVDIPNIRGQAVGGTIIASGKITPIRPVFYQGTVTLYNADLNQTTVALGARLSKPLLGTGYLKTQISCYGPGGNRSPLKTLAAAGEFEVAGARLWKHFRGSGRSQFRCQARSTTRWTRQRNIRNSR